MNLKKVISLINLAMCDTELLITEIRELMNAYKNEIKSEKKSACYFINFHHFLLPFTILFLFKDNPITFITVDSSLCQL